MTPEKLEEIAKFAEMVGCVCHVYIAKGKEICPVCESSAFLRRLAAKMREPDAWLCQPFGASEPYLSDHKEFEGDCRPILYLDILETTDE